MRSVKCVVEESMGPGGNLNNDKFGTAMLTYWNTPCRFLGLSPAQILFARMLRDKVPVVNAKLKIRGGWVLTVEQRELALARCHVART